jgi:response regulator RpfG family c-di-GMP phosphodiesterase
MNFRDLGEDSGMSSRGILQAANQKSLRQVIAPGLLAFLCIDDEEPGLVLRKALLESAGYRVLTARSGREGIRVFESNPVDAVVLEIG